MYPSPSIPRRTERIGSALLAPLSPPALHLWNVSVPSSMMADPSRNQADSGERPPLGTVVVLLADEGDRQWAGEAAIELCSVWASDGRRIVLTDLHFEEPLLHRFLGVSNLEGVVDIFAYGASLSRIAKPVRDSAFLFIPAGTYPSDAAAIYADARWKKLVAGFRDTDATLVLFTPEDSAGLAALARWSPDIILLGSPWPRPKLDELEAIGYQVRATIYPPERPSPTGGDRGDEDGIWPPAAQVGPLLGGAAAAVHRPPTLELELPPPPVRPLSERTGGFPFLWVAIAVVVIAALAYLLFSLSPGLLPGSTPERPPGAEGSAVEATPFPRAMSVPYSVPVKAFSSLTAAQEEVVTNRQRLQSVPFYVSAEVRQDILYYRVFAGTLADSAEATRLRQRLVAEGMIDEDDSPGWGHVELTPLAFDLGEFATMAAASARLDSLQASSIPAYATAIPYSDGSRRWQLYGGAFRDSASAEGMRDLLAVVGIAAEFSARSGSPTDPGASAGEE